MVEDIEMVFFVFFLSVLTQWMILLTFLSRTIVIDVVKIRLAISYAYV